MILTGHQHFVFPGGKEFANIPGVDVQKGTLHGKPAVMAGFWGSHLGIIDLDLAQERQRLEGQRLQDRSAPDLRARRPQDRAEGGVRGRGPRGRAGRSRRHAEIRARARRHDGGADPFLFLARLRRRLGEDRGRGAGLVRGRPAEEAPPHKDLPLLSAAAPFKAGGRGGPNYFTEIKPGPLAIKDMADIYIYPNTDPRREGHGRAGARMARALGRDLQPDRCRPRAASRSSSTHKFPAYNFDVIAGVQYKIDPTQPSRYDNDGKLVDPDAHRIKDLTYNGKPVADDQVFIVATNNYRAGGGGNFPGNDGKTIVLEAPDLTRDAIMRFIIERKEVSPKADGSWSLVPPPANVTATFLTGPNAAAYQPAGIKVEKMGDAPEGFVKYRIVS